MANNWIHNLRWGFMYPAYNNWNKASINYIWHTEAEQEDLIKKIIRLIMFLNILCLMQAKYR